MRCQCHGLLQCPTAAYLRGEAMFNEMAKADPEDLVRRPNVSAPKCKEHGVDYCPCPKEDLIRRPNHYIADGIEVRQVIRAFGLTYNMGTALAYILRADRKEDGHNALQDIRKAIQHLTFEVEDREKAGK